MYRRHVPEPVPEENTQIWSCTQEACNGWMRADYTFTSQPDCPFCSSQMEPETRMLPILNAAGGQYSNHS